MTCRQPGHTLTRPFGRAAPGVAMIGGMDTEVVQLRTGTVLSLISLKGSSVQPRPRRRTVSRLVRHATAGVVLIETGGGSGSDPEDALDRSGYVRRGLNDRVRQVDEQIKLCGGKPPR